jgi:hypothetical protein
MIDSKAFTTFNPFSRYNLRVGQPLDPHNLTEEQELICTPMMLGYCFGIKQWGMHCISSISCNVRCRHSLSGGFAMDRLRDITWTDEPLDSLVLSAKRKALIKALVGQHMKRAASYDDFVSGKGKVSQVGYITCRFSLTCLSRVFCQDTQAVVGFTQICIGYNL